MNDDLELKGSPAAPDLNEDEEALLKEMPELEQVGLSRREFLGHSIAGGLSRLRVKSPGTGASAGLRTSISTRHYGCARPAR